MKHTIMPDINAFLHKWREQHNPDDQLFIGIGGGTGSGKSSIARTIQERLIPLKVEIFTQDQFFKPAHELPTFYSEFHQGPQPDFNRPDSFFTETMFSECARITGHNVVILEGILVLFYPELRALMDIKCYVTLALEEMLIRRTNRNLAVGYGGPYEEIAHYNLECVIPQHNRYNAPTARYADLIIPNDHEDQEKKGAILHNFCEAILDVKREG